MADTKRSTAKAASKKKGPRAPKKVNVEAETDVVEISDEGIEESSADENTRGETMMGAPGSPTQEEIEDRRANSARSSGRPNEDVYDDDDDRGPNYNSSPDRGDRGDRGGERERHSKPQHSPPPTGGQPAVTRTKAGDDYSITVWFDRTSRQFLASVVEFPEVKSNAPDRERAMKETERKLENHVQELKRRGSTVTDAIAAKNYPERLEIPISQTLFRKLDQLSRHEKTGMDQLVAEILSAGVEKRFEPPQKSGGEHRPQQHQQHSHGRHQNERHQQHRDGNQRHQGGRDRDHRRGGGGHRQRDYNNTMENRESFLEYVRSLEKNGGYGRKK